MTILDQIIEAQQWLGKNRESARSPEEEKSYRLAIDALWFIWTNGQADELERYRAEVAAGAPERVMASFTTRAEAETWLKSNPAPANLALVLIADEYHAVISSPERDFRALVPDDALEHHLEEMMRKGLPAAVSSFTTRAEAEAWFNHQPDPPAQTVIQVGGEYHLAVSYRNLGRRVIFPFARVERLQARRDRRKREDVRE